MYRLAKIVVLTSILALAIIGVLRVADVIPADAMTSVLVKTFSILAIIYGAAFAWRGIQGGSRAPDRHDQRVP